MSHRAAPCLLAVLAFLSGVLVCPRLARAAEPSGAERGEVARGEVTPAPVHWDPAWPQFRTSEWIAGGAGIALVLTSRLLPVPSAHWRGGFAIDESARGALRFHTPSARRWARDASDIGITINASWPFFDALVVAGWYRHSPEVGVQQALISAEVLAVTAGVQQLVGLAVSRERPYGRECGGELPANTRDCLARDRYYSFFSGHSSHSFAAAAVSCMHHAYVPLYGGAADDWACAGGFGLAVTTALLRVATDVHYVSDVAIGALIGTTTGLMLPWALHYRHGAVPTGAKETGDVQLTVLPSLRPGFSGLHGVLVF